MRASVGGFVHGETWPTRFILVATRWSLLCRSTIGADLSDCLTHRGKSHTAAGGPQFGRSKSPPEKQIVTKERDLSNLKLELASIDGLKTLEGYDRKA